MVSLAPTEQFLGTSEAVRRLVAQAQSVARSPAPILIEGETGTGKNRLARLIHRQSGRPNHDFHTVDCGSIPPTIFAREMFGHVEGAFTGAERAQPGRLQAAHDGTFLLQGIEHLDPGNQSALLRVLDNGEVLPLGATRADHVNIRFMQTTQVSLADRVSDGAFRGDLFYRLNGLSLKIPPLRERREDLNYYLDHFLAVESEALRRPRPKLTRDLRERLLAYPWPGNVSELRHTLLGVLTVVSRSEIGFRDLPTELRERLEDKTAGPSRTRTFSIPVEMSFQRQIETFQKSLILRAWRETGRNRSALLEELGLAPHQLKYLVKKLALDLDHADQNLEDADRRPSSFDR